MIEPSFPAFIMAAEECFIARKQESVFVRMVSRKEEPEISER
jgi:hypothetical protein